MIETFLKRVGQIPTHVYPHGHRRSPLHDTGMQEAQSC